MRIRYLEKLPKPVDEASGQLGTSFTAIAQSAAQIAML